MRGRENVTMTTIFTSERQTDNEVVCDLRADRDERGISEEEYREELVQHIDEIDATKRDIKAQIHHRANQAKCQGRGISQVWLRRAKDKIDHLTRERADVRTELGDVNERIKERRRAHHGQADQTLAQEFMKAAKQELEPEVFEQILDKAALRARQ